LINELNWFVFILIFVIYFLVFPKFFMFNFHMLIQTILSSFKITRKIYCIHPLGIWSCEIPVPFFFLFFFSSTSTGNFSMWFLLNYSRVLIARLPCWFRVIKYTLCISSKYIPSILIGFFFWNLWIQFLELKLEKKNTYLFMWFLQIILK